MEHSLHVACKHFVEAVAPASPTAIRKKVKAALNRVKNSGSLDLDNNDALSVFDWDDIEDLEDNNAGEADEDDDSDTEFTAGDALGKAFALVKQVSTENIHFLHL
jgi:hypothetical protein